ncbi:MAG: hypothetical protein ACK4M3_07400 [Pyrobaculum sp.]
MSTLPVDRDTAREVYQMAKSRGILTIRFVSEALKLALDLYRRDITPALAREMYLLLEKTLAYDTVAVPLQVLELMAAKYGVCNDEEIERYLRDVGERFGRDMAAAFRNFGDFLVVAAHVFAILPPARISYSKKGDSWVVVFTSPAVHSLKCLQYFAEEVIRQFGCRNMFTQVENSITAYIEC